MERVTISPATAAQVHRSQKGVRVAVADDVQNVARDLREIRSTLTLEYDPIEDFWIVGDERTLPDGSIEEYLVTTAQECDQRLVQRVREIAQPSYNYADELERLEAQDERRQRQAFAEKVGPIGEQLAHALCKDLGLNGGRAFISRDVG